MYATSNTTNNGNPNGGGGGVAGGGGGGGGGGSSGNNSITGATSPPSNGPHGLQTLTAPHYYTTGTHPAGVPAAVPPPVSGSQSLDHIYYSFTTGTQQPQHTHQQHQSNTLQHGSMSIGDQQPLLLYTTDGSCQQSASSDAQNQPTEVIFLFLDLFIIFIISPDDF